MLGYWGVFLYSRSGKKIDSPTALHKLEIWYNMLFKSRPTDANEYAQAQSVQDKVSIAATSESAAAVMLKLSDEHRDEENSRLRWLRVLAVFVGTVLAYLLQVDATKVLATAIPGISNVVNLVIIKGPALHKFWSVFSELNDLTPGIILTGLAASAGSAFWHDQLDRLQATKNSAEQAMALVNKAKELGSGEQSNR